MRTQFLLPGICFYVLLAVTLWVYWPGLDGPFLFDDFANLPALGEYGEIRDGQGLIRYLAGGIAGPTGRPISLLSFLLNDTTWPSQPWPFKYTNLLIHVLNGTLLFWLCLKIIRLNNLPSLNRQAEWLALMTAGLWLLHPLYVATTLYVVQRMAMLAALFSLCGLLLYVWGREWLSQRPLSAYALMTLAVGPCTLLAVFSKENGALLPLLLGVVEYTVLRHQTRLQATPHRYWTGLFFGLTALATVIYLGRFLFAGFFATRGFTALERGMTEARALTTYLYHLAIPKLYAGTLFTDDFVLSHGLLDPPSTLWAGLAVLSLIAAALWVRRSYPLASLAVLFFFTGHLLESTIAPLDLYYEHRNYLPAIFLFLPLAYAAERHGKTLSLSALALLLLMGGFTYATAKLWSSERDLLLFWAAQHPDSIRAQRFAADFYYRHRQYEKAAEVLTLAIEKHPEDLRLRLHHTVTSCQAHKPGLENIRQIRQLVETQPVIFESQAFEMLDALVSLTGQARCQDLKLDHLHELAMSLLANPVVKDSASYRYLLNHILGLIALEKKDRQTALSAFSKALELSGSPETGLLEVGLLATHEFYPEALRHLQATEDLLRKTDLPVSGLLAKHDYPAEIARLRREIQQDSRNRL